MEADAEAGAPAVDAGPADTVEKAVAPPQPPPPPLPSRSALDPELRPLLLSTLKFTAGSSLIMSTVLICMLLLFYGSGWNPSLYYSNVRLGVLDLDGGVVGASLSAAAQDPRVPYTAVMLDASRYTLASVQADVEAGRLHAGFVALPGASAALTAAAYTPGATGYNAAGAVAFLFDEGRYGSALVSLLRSAAAQLAAGASAGATHALLAAAAAANASAAMLNPGVLAAPVATTVLNLHPVAYPGEHTAAGIAFIDLWIIMLGATNAQLGFFESVWEKNGIRRDHAVLGRMLFEIVVAGALSFWPAVILRGLGTPLDAPLFCAVWAYVWLCMLVFGLFITALMRNLGMAKGNLVHTVFLILNLVSSSSITPTVLMPPFFRIGYGLPFFNAVQGMRTLLFGSGGAQQLGRSIGVLFAWIGFILLTALRAARAYRADLRAASVAAP